MSVVGSKIRVDRFNAFSSLVVVLLKAIAEGSAKSIIYWIAHSDPDMNPKSFDLLSQSDSIDSYFLFNLTF